MNQFIPFTANNFLSFNQKKTGFSLIELMLVISLVSVLSFAVFKGVRVGYAWLNIGVAERQAAALVSLMQIDYELANAQRPILRITDFFGHMYTRHWPRSAATVFQGVSEPIASVHDLQVDRQGCIANISELRPCFSPSQGFWVEFNTGFSPGTLQEPSALELRQVRLQGNKTGHTLALINTGADAQILQNHYFLQTQSSAISQLDIENDEERQQRVLRNANRAQGAGQ